MVLMSLYNYVTRFEKTDLNAGHEKKFFWGYYVSTIPRDYSLRI